jgi:nicotinate-nucleotide pyrophosphorylase (carboxylating)
LTDEELIERALAEDIGDGDATTAATVDAGARARALIVQKESGVISGLQVAAGVFRHLDPAAEVQLGPEGMWRESGVVLVVEGDARALLTAERTALNFLGRLSGIATLTARVVAALRNARGPALRNARGPALRNARGTARLLDTRKTTPGLRRLEKAAVAHGGGVNHRAGLYDAILIKENHAALAGGVGEAVRRAREARPDLPLSVEVRDGGEIDAALAAGAPRLLLDNMSPFEVAAAVAQVAGRAEIEVSGGVTPDTILVYATIEGVDYVSMGALTHSAPALDLSLALEAISP